MLANDYAGIIPPEVPPLIAGRARRLGVTAGDIDDLQQLIIPQLAKFTCQPRPAAPVTALIAVIDRQIKAYLRAERRYRQRLERIQSQNPLAAKPRPEGFAPLDLRIDLAAALVQLSPRQREICLGLGEGRSIKEIARQMGCCRGSVSRTRALIRRQFTRLGLHRYGE